MATIVFLIKLNTLPQNLKHRYTEAFDENGHDHRLSEHLPW